MSWSYVTKVKKVLPNLVSVVVIFTLMGIAVFADNVALRAIPAISILITAVYLREKADRALFKEEKLYELLDYSREATANFDGNDSCVKIKCELGEDKYDDILDKVGLVAIAGNEKQRYEALSIFNNLANDKSHINPSYLMLRRLNFLISKLEL